MQFDLSWSRGEREQCCQIYLILTFFIIMNILFISTTILKCFNGNETILKILSKLQKTRITGNFSKQKFKGKRFVPLLFHVHSRRTLTSRHNNKAALYHPSLNRSGGKACNNPSTTTNDAPSSAQFIPITGANKH